MSNFLQGKEYTAEAAIGQYRIAKVGAADGGALQGAAATDKLIGVVTTPGGAASGERVSVIYNGTAEVEAGGTVARGDPLTSDATGRGVTAAPAAGTNNRIIGFAEVSAVVGDIFRVTLSIGSFQG